jgi:hypothetical protein
MTVRFERVAGFGHSGALVARFLPDVVALAATARVPSSPPRVTYRSARASDSGAYGVKLVRAQGRSDAYVDVERAGDAVHVRHAQGVRSILLARGALGTDPAAPPAVVDDTRSVEATWEAPP